MYFTEKSVKKVNVAKDEKNSAESNLPAENGEATDEMIRINREKMMKKMVGKNPKPSG